MTTTIDKSAYPFLFSGSTSYGILAQSALTTVNNTTVNDGVYGCANAGGITGSFTGTLDNDNVLNATTELTNLVNDISALSLTPVTYTGGPQTFVPGNVYVNAGINPSGVLTFAATNPTDQFFIVSSSTIIFADVTFVFTGGAQASNIFWVAGTAITFSLADASPTMNGNFIAATSISITSAFNYIINGKFLVQTAAVTFGGTGLATLNADPICFLKGTQILTVRGYVAIVDIDGGAQVITQGVIHENGWVGNNHQFNVKSVIWKGGFQAANLNTHTWPIRICAGALGKNHPIEDLLVSPGHRIIEGGYMRVARDMINHDTIYQDCSLTEIEYYYLELDMHSVILANGVTAETFLCVEETTRDIFTYSPSLIQTENPIAAVVEAMT